MAKDMGVVKATGVRQKAAPEKAQSGSAESTPSARALQAVEVLCLRGPMTYKELGKALSMTKAAVWRLVATLREVRWVCIGQGGSIIQLNPRLDELFASAHFADAEFSGVADVMLRVAGEFPVYIDLYCQSRDGEVALHETSRRLIVSAPMTDAPEEQLFLALYAAMTPVQRDRCLALLKAVDPDRAHQLDGTDTRRKVASFPGQIWGNGEQQLFVALRGRMGTAAVMCISAKQNTVNATLLVSVFNRLLADLKDKLEIFGGGKPIRLKSPPPMK